MTNLRDALEKAGVTNSGVPADSSSPKGEAVDSALDNIVDDLANRLSPSDDAATPAIDLDENRPKLVPDTSALAGVVDRIEQLVTGESTDESEEVSAATSEPLEVDAFSETDETNNESATLESEPVESASTDSAPLESALGESVKTEPETDESTPGEFAAAESETSAPTPEQAILPSTDSIPSVEGMQPTTATDPFASEAAPMTDLEAVSNDDPGENVTAEMKSAAAFTNGPPPVDMSSIPMLKTEKISGNTTLVGKFSKDLLSIEDNDAATDSHENFDQVTAGVEVSQYDPLGIEGDLSIDPNQSATFDEYDEYEVVPSEANEDIGDAQAASAASFELETEGQPDTDTRGFDPELIHGISPGTTMTVETTQESSLVDPVAAASELTGTYEPQDLDRPEQFELASPTGEPSGAPAPADDSVDSQQGFSFPKSLTERALKDADGNPAPIVPNEEGADEVASFLETTNLQPAAIPTIQPAAIPTTIPAAAIPTIPTAPTIPTETPIRAAGTQNIVEDKPVAFRDYEPPASVTTEDTDNEPTAFERHLLENLTVEPSATEYKALATAAVTANGGSSPNSICFVSAEAGSHHTDVVAHLAVIYAATMNKRVLVVDASDCPDSLTRVFRRDKQPGLKNMTSVADDWSDMVLPTAIPNLFLLPHGWRRGASTRWNAGEFSGLISLFSRAFDITLLDAGVAERSEDAPFYAACDRTLMIARLGQTDRHMAAAVKDGLINAHVKLDGCVVTNHSA